MQIHAKQKSVPFSKAWETNLFRAGSERPKIGKTAFSPLSLLLAPEDSFHPLFPPSLDEARRQGANYQTEAERGNEHTKLSTEPAGQTPGWWLGGTKAAPFPQDCPVPSVVPSPGSSSGSLAGRHSAASSNLPIACWGLHLSTKQSQKEAAPGVQSPPRQIQKNLHLHFLSRHSYMAGKSSVSPPHALGNTLLPQSPPRPVFIHLGFLFPNTRQNFQVSTSIFSH